MILPTRLIAAAVAAVALLVAMEPARAQAQRGEIEAVVKNYLATHPGEIEAIVKNYLVKHPEVLQEAITELMKRNRPAAADAGKQKEQIKSNAAALFSSTRQVTLGNPQGDVTMVEFFDYNCGYCKRALTDMLDLMKDDPKLKVVLKELPVLGPGSLEAARVAIAVRMQDPSGAKYLEFHRRLLSDRGQADKARALAVASGIGLDMARLENDMASNEVRETLEESTKLASALGIGGTPSYVIGETIVPGAVGIAALNDRIKAARK